MANDASDPTRPPLGWKAWIGRLHANHPAVYALEVLAGAGFLTALWVHKNLWFFAPGFSLLWSPVVAIFSWERRWVRWPAMLPAMSVVVLLVLIGVELARRR